jgi:MoaA/NifB/PqqE/SkfB family radical SAM enzyme
MKEKRIMVNTMPDVLGFKPETEMLSSKHLCWYMTERCNGGCDFCFRYKEGQKDLSRGEALRVIDNLSELGISKITFTGEPLLVSWTLEAVGYAKRLGMFTTIMTNGSLLTEYMVVKLSQSLDRLALPIDGSTEEMNCKMSRRPNHLEKVMNISRWVEDSPIKLKISTVITKINLQDAVAISAVVKSVKAVEWKLEQFRPNRGDAILNREKFEIGSEAFEQVAQKCKSACAGSGIKVGFVSLRDRYGDFFLMKPQGDLEVSTGEKYYSLGNVLVSRPWEIIDNYREVIK